MKHLIGLVFLVSLIGAPAVLAVDWWPTVDGAEFRYENDAGEALIVTIEDRGDGSYARVFEKYGHVIHLVFTIADDGDVVLTLWEKHTLGGVFVESRTIGLHIITSPIQPGYFSGGPFYQFDQDGGVYNFEAYITVAPDMVSLEMPAGTFETYLLGIGVYQGITYFSGGYLHKQLGPIRMAGGWDLVSWSGIVGNEETTWGDLKAAYR